VENVFLIFGGGGDCGHVQQPAQAGAARGPRRGEGSSLLLAWSEDAITFSREDHLNCIPNPGQYPLVVDPVIRNTRFSKVLMDGGSSLNILYTHTLRLLGIGLD
jgi:hypothetical protein